MICRCNHLNNVRAQNGALKLKLDLKWAAELKAQYLGRPRQAMGCWMVLRWWMGAGPPCTSSSSGPRWDSTDFGKWQAGVREELLSSYLAYGVSVQ
jgi:hypothetical protein